MQGWGYRGVGMGGTGVQHGQSSSRLRTFLQGPGGKHPGFTGPLVAPEQEGSDGQDGSGWGWLGAHKTLFTKAGGTGCGRPAVLADSDTWALCPDSMARLRLCSHRSPASRRGSSQGLPGRCKRRRQRWHCTGAGTLRTLTWLPANRWHVSIVTVMRTELGTTPRKTSTCGPLSCKNVPWFARRSQTCPQANPLGLSAPPSRAPEVPLHALLAGDRAEPPCLCAVPKTRCGRARHRRVLSGGCGSGQLRNLPEDPQGDLLSLSPLSPSSLFFLPPHHSVWGGPVVRAKPLCSRLSAEGSAGDPSQGVRRCSPAHRLGRPEPGRPQKL